MVSVQLVQRTVYPAKMRKVVWFARVAGDCSWVSVNLFVQSLVSIVKFRVELKNVLNALLDII
jgi:hypothetical protein